MNNQPPKSRGAAAAYLVVAVVLLIAGVAVYKLFFTGGAQQQQGMPPIPVTLLTLSDEPFYERVSLLGEARSSTDASVAAEAPGVVSQLMADVGDQVKAGQALAYLDGVEQRIALAQAESRLAEARSRLDELLNGTRSAVLEQRRAEYRSAVAQTQEALSNLERVKALAPQVVRQVEGDYQSAKAAEESARDNLRRTEELVKQGALSERELVRVRSEWEQARGAFLRAEQARSVTEVENRRDLLQAEAQLEAARAEEARTKAVLEEAQEGPRRETIEAQRSVVNALEAARDQEKVDLERATIRTKADGTIRTREVSVGDRVEVGDTLFMLSGSNVEVYFDVPESFAGKVEPGQTVLIGGQTREGSLQGEVVAVAQAFDSSTRRQSIRVSLPPNSKILAGAAVRGVLLIPAAPGALSVNRDALVKKEGGWTIYTLDSENKAVAHQVDLLASAEERVAIAAPDLNAGTQVVGRGAPGLFPGASVRLPEPDPSGSPTPASVEKKS